jgi:plasmid stabilization system protein ParE
VTQVQFTEPAAQDLEEIYDYIAQDNIEAAERLKERLK